MLVVHASMSRLGWVAGGAPAVLHALLDVLGERRHADGAGPHQPPVRPGRLVQPARARGVVARGARVDARLPRRRDAGALDGRARRHRAAPPRRGAQLAPALLDGGPRAAGAGAVRHPRAGLEHRPGLAARPGRATTTARCCCSASGTARTRRCTWPRWAASGGARNVVEGTAPALVDGTPASGSRGRNVAYDEGDFEAIGAAFAAETGLERVGPVGRGEARLMPQRELVRSRAAGSTPTGATATSSAGGTASCRQVRPSGGNDARAQRRGSIRRPP